MDAIKSEICVRKHHFASFRSRISLSALTFMCECTGGVSHSSSNANPWSGGDESDGSWRSGSINTEGSLVFLGAKIESIRRLSQLPEGFRQSQPPRGYRGAMPHANPGSRGAAREICFFRYPDLPLLADFGSLSTTVMNQ